MGTVFQKNGKWYINYRFRGRRYKRIVGRSKKKAMEALRVVEADVIRDRFGLPAAKKMTFRELANFWLENYSKVSNASSQYEKNRERIDNHLLPYFGGQDIANITPRQIDEYKKSKTGEISSATINRTLAILRKMFNDAIRWGFVAASPMRHVSQLREPEKGFDFYSDDEVRQFLRNCSSDFFPIACCAVYTGMRVSEIVGLKWKDIDLDRRVIRVERSSEGTTKSKKVRYVPVNSRLLEVLKALHKTANGEFVFHDGKGGMRSIDFRTEMRKAAEKAGIRKIRMHDLRHTFASNYVIKGGNIVSLQKILGHSTINMTLRYAHLAPDFMAKDIERLDFELEWSLVGPRKEAVH